MISTQITVEDSEVQRALTALGSRADAAMRRAANRATSTATKVLKREGTNRYYAQSTMIGSTLKVTRASSGTAYAKVTSQSAHENLTKFKTGPNRPVRRTKSGGYSPKAYKGAVERSNAAKPLDGDPKPFYARMKNGHEGIFVRKNNQERAIKGVYAPAVPQILKNDGILIAVKKEAGDMMLKRLVHELERELP